MPLSFPTSEAPFPLPPLILHPFNEGATTAARREYAGCPAPSESAFRQSPDCEQVRLSSRYAELRMLYFIGKDLERWIGQCMEACAKLPWLAGAGIEPQSFAVLVSQNPPDCVQQKLRSWGVAGHGVIFARAIGMRAVFAEPPWDGLLGVEFLRNYPLYADVLFQCYLDSAAYTTLSPTAFPFEIFTSGEYAQMLSERWTET